MFFSFLHTPATWSLPIEIIRRSFDNQLFLDIIFTHNTVNERLRLFSKMNLTTNVIVSPIHFMLVWRWPIIALQVLFSQTSSSAELFSLVVIRVWVGWLTYPREDAKILDKLKKLQRGIESLARELKSSIRFIFDSFPLRFSIQLQYTHVYLYIAISQCHQ